MWFDHPEQISPEVLKRLSPCDDLLCDPVMSRDGDIVGNDLSPQIRLIKTVNLWNKEGDRRSLAPGRAGGGSLSLQSYLTRRSLWTSRRSTSGGDGHEDVSLRSSLDNHKPWCSWEKAPSQATNRDVEV